MTINANEPLNLQYGRACAGAASLLNKLSAANARNDFHKAEVLLYELHDLVELGLRVTQRYTEILNAPADAYREKCRGPWNPQDGTRVLPGVEFMENGEYYVCNTVYRQFQAGDALVAWDNVWYRLEAAA